MLQQFSLTSTPAPTSAVPHTSKAILVGLAVATLLLGGCGGGDATKLKSEPGDDLSGSLSTQSASDTKTTSSEDQSAIAKSTGISFEEKLAKTEKLLQADQADAAWDLAKDLIVERPQSAPAIFLAARIMAKRNNVSGAMQMVSKIDPNDPEAGPAATGQLAEWLAQTGNLAEAEVKLKGLLKKFPSAAPAIRLLVDIYNAQGRRWEASRWTDRMIRMGNFSTADLMNSIDVREPTPTGPLRKAALEFAPEEPYSQLGDLRNLTNADRWIDAMDPLAKMVKDRPDLLEPWVWYGESLLETGRISDMTQWLANPPEGYEKHPEYWYIYGRLLLQQEDPQRAAGCFVESLKLDRRHLASIQSLSECLMEMGQRELALEIRSEAGHLVRIKDLSQQIQRGLGKREEFIQIADLYRRLQDSVGAFGWDAILLVNEKKPITAELIEVQKKLRAGEKLEIPWLAKLPVADWPRPESNEVKTKEPDSPSPGFDFDSIPIRFSDRAAELGFMTSYNNGAEQGRGWYTLEGIGGGVSAIDYDRDGWPDLFHSQAGDSVLKENPAFAAKELHRSFAGKRFQNMASVAYLADRGYGQGTGVADIDQDGFSDVLIADIGEIKWYRNQGDGTFEKMRLPQASSGALWNSSIQAADINGDTLPDIIQGAYINGDEVFSRKCPTPQNPNALFCHPKRFEPGKSRILLNDGGGQWVLADPALLESLVDGYALGTLVTNIDQQNGNDVFFANDVSPNHLLLSQKSEDGQLELVESAMRAGVAVDSLGRSQASMGVACGDQNRDGLLDIVVTNFRYEVSTLYLQTSPGVFVDGTRASRLGEPTLEWLSFGCQLSDLDNDGWLDFITVNGHIDFLTPWQMPPQVLRSNRGKFEWLRKPSPGTYFDVDNVGRSLTQIDFNRDGRLDFAITHLDRPSALLQNDSPATKNHHVQFEIVGTISERDAIGAMVHVRSGAEAWVVPVSVGDGFYGTNERIVHVGLGAIESIDSVEIAWPTGKRESYLQLKPDRRYRIIESVGVHEVTN